MKMLQTSNVIQHDPAFIEKNGTHNQCLPHTGAYCSPVFIISEMLLLMIENHHLSFVKVNKAEVAERITLRFFS